MVDVGPHDFKRLRRFFNKGRCETCFVHENAHPVTGWVRARPWRDKALPYEQKMFVAAEKETR